MLSLTGAMEGNVINSAESQGLGVPQIQALLLDFHYLPCTCIRVCVWCLWSQGLLLDPKLIHLTKLAGQRPPEISCFGLTPQCWV